MNKILEMMFEILAIILLVEVFLPVPLGIIWGWVRWCKRTQAPTFYSLLSVAGLTLCTMSAVLAVSSIMYARAIGGFPYYDPLLMTIYRWGGNLPLAGVLLCIGDVRRKELLSWLAPACSLGMFVFWFLSAGAE